MLDDCLDPVEQQAREAGERGRITWCTSHDANLIRRGRCLVRIGGTAVNLVERRPLAADDDKRVDARGAVPRTVDEPRPRR